MERWLVGVGLGLEVAWRAGELASLAACICLSSILGLYITAMYVCVHILYILLIFVITAGYSCV